MMSRGEIVYLVAGLTIGFMAWLAIAAWLEAGRLRRRRESDRRG